MKYPSDLIREFHEKYSNKFEKLLKKKQKMQQTCRKKNQQKKLKLKILCILFKFLFTEDFY